MAGKNLHIIVLGPSEEKIFESSLSWLSIGAVDPTLVGDFEVHGLAENNTDVMICKKQSFTTPENTLIQNNVKIKASSSNTTDINIAYRY